MDAFINNEDMQIYVKKKAGNLENWDPNKIVKAVGKSADRIATKLNEEETTELLAIIEKRVFSRSDNIIPVEMVHSLVEMGLQTVRPDVAESYKDYRNWVKRNAKEMAEIDKECRVLQFLGDKSNANSNSSLVSTRQVKKREILQRYQYRKYFLNSEERKALEEGYIYVHDQAGREDTMNCCLFDIASVLHGGFEMGNIWYNEPKTLDVAFDVIGDIVLSAASQQYGGFTLPEIDKVLSPYAEKSYHKYMDKYVSRCGMTHEAADKLATEDVIYEMKQGFQGWEYKFNTVASSRGDYPFVTITFGLSTDMWGRELSRWILKVRAGGQGKAGHKKPVLFAKLVFLFDKNLHLPGCELADIFEEGVNCSSKTMYPDWLSLTGKGYVPSIYEKYGLVISPMGCRAFLSPWYERGGMEPADENDRPVFVGRFNIGAVSLNLPMILAKSHRSGEDFYKTLDYYLNMIRNLHSRTYEYLGEMSAANNPLAYCEGGFLGGHLKLTDKIKPLLKSATASFGITALNELQMLYNGKSLVEDGDFALEVMKYIQNKINEFKKKDGHLYAIYGTPAESLCHLQVEQFRKEFGIIPGVSDREYVSNSFHCHVTENITPIEKQDLENRFWDLFNGGKIQYVRYPIDYNIAAIRTLILRAMEMGFYEGVNLSLAYCDDCGHQELEMDVCPKCGSRNLTKIDRMNGYLAYSRIHGDTRLNAGKMAEIADRVSM